VSDIEQEAVTYSESVKTFLAIEFKYILWCLGRAVIAPLRAARDAWREAQDG
jgi:hypothetical protein